MTYYLNKIIFPHYIYNVAKNLIFAKGKNH